MQIEYTKQRWINSCFKHLESIIGKLSILNAVVLENPSAIGLQVDQYRHQI